MFDRGRQVQTDTGPLDILALDEEGTVLIIELKVVEDESQLDQGLRYFDWVTSNRERIARAYPGEKINVERNPQLILIAPNFPKIQRIAKYIDEDVGLNLLTYDAIKLPTGEKSVICRCLELERPPEPKTPPTEEGVLSVIKNEKIRQLCSHCLNDLKGLNVEIRPHRDWFSIFYRGTRLAELIVRVKSPFFWFRSKRPDGSEGECKVSSEEEWEKIFRNEVYPTYQSRAESCSKNK